MGVVTSSGGGSNLIADKASESGFTLPALSIATAESLRAVLPPFASVQNPLDVTGFWMNTGGGGKVLKPEDDALEKVSRDPSMDLVVHVMTALPNARPADPAPVEARIHALAAVMRQSPIPTFTTTLANLPIDTYPRELLAAAGIHLLPGVDLGLTAIAHATRWNQGRARLLAESAAVATAARPAFVGGLAGSLPAGNWSEHEARDWLTAMGVSCVPARLVASADEAVSAAQEMGWPVVLKLCSREVPHKSDIGGVALRLQDANSARQAYARVIQAGTGKKVDGVLVSPMREQGVELLLGVTRDATFGLVLTVGLGGVWVEILKDVATRVLPVTRPQIHGMIRDLRGAALLQGARGGVAADMDKVVEILFRFAEAALSLGDRLEAAEINPLLVNAGQVEALDALVITR